MRAHLKREEMISLGYMMGVRKNSACRSSWYISMKSTKRADSEEMRRATPSEKAARMSTPTGKNQQVAWNGCPRNTMMSTSGTSEKARLTRPFATADTAKIVGGR